MHREIITKEIPYVGIPILKIINSVGYENYSIQIPKKGQALLIELVDMCLNRNRNKRPTFKRILEKLQERRKHKKSNI